MKLYRAVSLTELAATKRAPSGRQCPDIELGRERQLAGLICAECGIRRIPKTPKRGGMPRVTCRNAECKRSHALGQRKHRNYKTNQYRRRLRAGLLHYCTVCRTPTDLKRPTCGAPACVREHLRRAQRIRNLRYQVRVLRRRLAALQATAQKRAVGSS